MSTRPRLLDLFCGAGGAAMGYHRAGFDVVGVDIIDQPHYPFEFHRGDALFWGTGGYDAIHASPPCQRYSRMTHVLGDPGSHPDLMEDTRVILQGSGVPWIIENVPGAPMRTDYKLCGCMFGLPGLRRERWFETSWHGFDLRAPCAHTGRTVGVYGYSGPRGGSGVLSGRLATWSRAMGIDWMTAMELRLAVPPAYTEHLGRALMAEVELSRKLGSQLVEHQT